MTHPPKGTPTVRRREQLPQPQTPTANTLLRQIKYWLLPQLGRFYQYPPRPLQVETITSSPAPAQGWPRISVVTPSYNQAHYLESTIHSILDQHYPALEYIIQDGGSTDESPAIIERFRPRLHAAESVKDKGQSDAINKGFAKATGAILAWVNSDDLLLPGALHHIGAYFAAHPEVDVVYGHRVIINQHGAETARWLLPPHDNRVLDYADYIPQETLFWRRSLWEKVGGQVDESFRFALDWDLILRFRDAGARFVRLPYFLGAFRVHAEQKTTAQLLEIGWGEMASLRSRYKGGRRVGMSETYFNTRLYIYRHWLLSRAWQLGWIKG
jgi:glycosyltransferase involved in cell wall biosynthesis